MRKIDQFLRNTLFGQNALDERLVASGPAEAGQQRPAAFIGIEIVDVAEHRIRHLKRQLGRRGLQLFLDLRLQLRIDREGHFEDVFERSLVVTGRAGKISGAQTVHIVFVNGRNELFKLFLDFVSIRESIRRRKKQIDSLVELDFWLVERSPSW